MTQEERDLIWKDLCARFPYGVKIKRTNCPINLYVTGIVGKYVRHIPFYVGGNIEINTSIIEEIKPYLRPLSSMTEEEREELSDYLCEQVMSNKIGITIPPNPTQGKGIPFIWMGDCMEWLNKHHFDYRGLIEKGLALEAPEDLYD